MRALLLALCFPALSPALSAQPPELPPIFAPNTAPAPAPRPAAPRASPALSDRTRSLLNDATQLLLANAKSFDPPGARPNAGRTPPTAAPDTILMDPVVVESAPLRIHESPPKIPPLL